MERIEGIKKPNNVVNRNQPSQVQDIINDKSPTEKEIKKVKKKLDQIEKLKQKQANGETLEICQVSCYSGLFSFLYPKKIKSTILFFFL